MDEIKMYHPICYYVYEPGIWYVLKVVRSGTETLGEATMMDFFSELGFKPHETEKRHNTAPKVTWREIAAKLTDDFMNWGCRFSRNQLPEIAMGYECTPLFFWNWLDGETDPSEKGFLRVLGYAWRKCCEEEAEPAPRVAADLPAEPVRKQIAA